MTSQIVRHAHSWRLRLLSLTALFVFSIPTATLAQETQELRRPAADSLAGSRPNLVLIIADDVSATDVGCYGNPDVRTPKLDRLASQGQMWSRAYLTATVCSPTRCSIITGRYPHNTGAPELHTALPEGQPMFPRQLRKAGYWTAQAGKWHLGGYAREAFDKVVDDGDRNGASGIATMNCCWTLVCRIPAQVREETQLPQFGG